MISVNDVISFLSVVWQFLQGIAINVGEFHFSLANIILTEMIVGLGFILVNLLWHLGVYNTGGD